MKNGELKEIQNEIENALGDLSNHLKIKGSLLKLDSESAWESLEKGVKKIKGRIDHDLFRTKADLDHAEVKGHLAMMEAREEWEGMKVFLEKMIDTSGVNGAIDELKLKAHLAEMDATDRFSEVRSDWEKSYDQEILPNINKVMDKMKEEISSFSDSFKSK